MERSNEKTIKKFNSRMQARLLLVFCVVTLLLFGLMGRLVYIMQTDGSRYAKKVLSRQATVSNIIPYKRGDILDRNGTVLARSELRYRLIIDPKRLLSYDKYIETTIEALNKYFEIDPESIREILTERSNSQYVILKKNLTYDVVDEFKKIMKDSSDIACVSFEEEYIRTYPYDTIACDVLGFTSADNNGYWGIEEYYNDHLNGTNGREYGYYDSTLNIERIVKKAVNGNSVVSTIDVNVQRIIQKHIKEFNDEFGSKGIGVLVMNPNNGEVIAMASNQEFNLNDPRNLSGIIPEEELSVMTEDEKMDELNKLWRNDVISMGYEPGSTFKPITIAAGMEEALIGEDNTFFCDGIEHPGGVKITCNNQRGHGDLTLTEVLMKSCNDALMQIAALEGKDNFFRYEKNFGFGKKTGIDLPGEESGIIIKLDNLNATELATSSFGQSFNATMIQMAAAFSSLVNGGYYYQPHMVKQIINDNGATVNKMDPVIVRQTVSEKTSSFLQKALYQTVEAGTAQGAKVEGYAIGGKTGTAQKLPREAKTYLVSFIGAVPAVNPEMTIYVIIDEPQNVVKQADSSIATKFASRILKEILPTMGIFPEGDIDYLLPVPDENANSNSESNNGNINSDNVTGSTNDGTSNENTNDTPDTNIDQNGNQSNDNQNSDNQGTDNQNNTNGEAITNPDNIEDEFNPDAIGFETEDTPDPSEETAGTQDETTQ